MSPQYPIFDNFTSSQPGGKIDMGVFAFEDSILVVGGMGYSINGTFGRMNDVWEYNLTVGKWRFVKGRKGVDGMEIVVDDEDFDPLNLSPAFNRSQCWSGGGLGFVFSGSFSGYPLNHSISSMDSNVFYVMKLETKEWKRYHAEEIANWGNGEFNSTIFPAQHLAWTSCSYAKNTHISYCIGGKSMYDNSFQGPYNCDYGENLDDMFMFDHDESVEQWRFVSGSHGCDSSGNFGAVGDFSNVYHPPSTSFSPTFISGDYFYVIVAGSGDIFAFDMISEEWGLRYQGYNGVVESYGKRYDWSTGNTFDGRGSSVECLGRYCYLFFGFNTSGIYYSEVFAFDTNTKLVSFVDGVNVPNYQTNFTLEIPGGGRSRSTVTNDGVIYIFGGDMYSSQINYVKNWLWSFDGYLCYGIHHSNESVCSGRGICVSSDVCRCDDGFGRFENCSSRCLDHYYGSMCQITTCNDTFSNDTEVCLGGECVEYEVCNYCTPYLMSDEFLFFDNFTDVSRSYYNFNGDFWLSIGCSVHSEDTYALKMVNACPREVRTRIFEGTVDLRDYEISFWIITGIDQCEIADIGDEVKVYVVGIESGEEYLLTTGRSNLWDYYNTNFQVHGDFYVSFRQENCLSSQYDHYAIDDVRIFSTDVIKCGGFGVCNDRRCGCRENYYGYDDQCTITTCGGIFSNDSNNVCSGKAEECNAFNECTCKRNYYDELCEVTTCFGIFSNDTNVCSGKAISCWEYNECNCEDGYYGFTCNITSCSGILSNDSSVCMGMASCFPKDVCNCEPNPLGGSLFLESRTRMYMHEIPPTIVGWDNGLLRDLTYGDFNYYFLDGGADMFDGFLYPRFCKFGASPFWGFECDAVIPYKENQIDFTQFQDIRSSSYESECFRITTQHGWTALYDDDVKMFSLYIDYVFLGGGSCGDEADWWFVYGGNNGYDGSSSQCLEFVGEEISTYYMENIYGTEMIITHTLVSASGTIEGRERQCVGDNDYIYHRLGDDYGTLYLYLEWSYLAPSYINELISADFEWSSRRNITHCNSTLNQTQCSDHGSCAVCGLCICDDNYWSYGGGDCDITSCNGVLSNESEVCTSSIASYSCWPHDNCNCKINYYGEDCSVTSCSGTFSNDSSVCNNHQDGDCVAYDTCRICGLNCQRNSSCEFWIVNDEYIPYCDCKQGTLGDLCEYEEGCGHLSYCSGHGSCIGYSCYCEYQWTEEPDCSEESGGLGVGGTIGLILGLTIGVPVALVVLIVAFFVSVVVIVFVISYLKKCKNKIKLKDLPMNDLVENGGEESDVEMEEDGMPALSKKEFYNFSNDPNETKICEYCEKKNDVLFKCGRCYKVFFCDDKCQKDGWETHKDTCSLNSEARQQDTKEEVKEEEKSSSDGEIENARTEDDEDEDAGGGVGRVVGNDEEDGPTYVDYNRGNVGNQ